MFKRTETRVTFGLLFWLGMGVLVLGWQLNGLLERASQGGVSFSGAQRTLIVLLLLSWVISGLGTALIIRYCIGVPLANLLKTLASFRAAGEREFTGLVPLTRRPHDFNRVGEAVNYLMNRFQAQRFGDLSIRTNSPSTHRNSQQQYAD